MSLAALLTGNATLIVGVDTDPDEPDLTRVYINSRGLCQYVLVSGPSADEVRRAWGSGHKVTMPTPREYYVDDAERARLIAKANEVWA
jgi:hypothetical protein